LENILYLPVFLGKWHYVAMSKKTQCFNFRAAPRHYLYEAEGKQRQVMMPREICQRIFDGTLNHSVYKLVNREMQIFSCRKKTTA